MHKHALHAVMIMFVLSMIVISVLFGLQPLFYGQDMQVFTVTLPGLDGNKVLNIIGVLSVAIVALGSYVAYLLMSAAERAEGATRRRTRELTLHRGHLLKLYDQSPVPYLTLLPNGKVHNPNLAALRLFGMNTEELEGAQFFEMQPEEDRDMAKSLFARFRSGVPFERQEIRVVCKDGTVRWVMLSVFLFRVHGQRQQRGLATLFDITEQKNLDKAKTEFVSLAGHQLRTPLSTVKWHTEVLLSDKYGVLNEKQREYVRKVRHGNQAMVDLVDLLLNVSRIELGTLPVEMQETHVRVLVDDVLEELSPRVEEKKIIIKTQYDDERAQIQSDPRLLRIVLQNLLSNAVKYTPEDGHVTFRFGIEGGKYVFEVSDTGYGIPAEQQDKIFTKMFRADNVRKKNVEGNGLGLYLVQSVVEKLGGTISFTSVVDKGSTFTVVLS